MVEGKKGLQGRVVFDRSRGVELKAFRARFNGFTEMFAKIRVVGGAQEAPLSFVLIFGGVLIE